MMRIGLIIAEFESGFASSFKHTARVKYGVDFDSSVIEQILTNLGHLRHKIQSEEYVDIKVGWEMQLDHVLMLESTLTQILNRYEEVFGIRPLNKKVYEVNQKLRESELLSPQEYAKVVLREVLTPVKQEKKSAQKQIKEDAQRLSVRRALKNRNKIM
jgi:hypothetical protein